MFNTCAVNDGDGLATVSLPTTPQSQLGETEDSPGHQDSPDVNTVQDTTPGMFIIRQVIKNISEKM